MIHYLRVLQARVLLRLSNLNNFSFYFLGPVVSSMFRGYFHFNINNLLFSVYIIIELGKFLLVLFIIHVEI
jgi:hypothetical protein